MTQRSEHVDGALFAQSDYAGIARRVVAIVVDMLVVYAAWVPIAVVWYGFIRPGEEPLAEAFLSWLAFLYLYLAICKATPIRTIGYRLAGVRIVDYQGRRPGFLRMTFRFMLLSLGPLNSFFNWLWLCGDHHKQTLRDKCAGTYVVRSKARPVGMSQRKAAYYSCFGLTLIFVEIQSPRLEPVE